MEKFSILSLSILITICVLGQVEKAAGSNKRCYLPGAKTFRACKISCKVLGHDTGACDAQDRCICSETEYDFTADIQEWFEENIDVTTMVARMDSKYTEYKERFKKD